MKIEMFLSPFGFTIGFTRIFRKRVGFFLGIQETFFVEHGLTALQTTVFENPNLHNCFSNTVASQNRRIMIWKFAAEVGFDKEDLNI